MSNLVRLCQVLESSECTFDLWLATFSNPGPVVFVVVVLSLVTCVHDSRALEALVRTALDNDLGTTLQQGFLLDT
jgi:hypothetical protein